MVKIFGEDSLITSPGLSEESPEALLKGVSYVLENNNRYVVDRIREPINACIIDCEPLIGLIVKQELATASSFFFLASQNHGLSALHETFVYQISDNYLESMTYGSMTFEKLSLVQS